MKFYCGQKAFCSCYTFSVNLCKVISILSEHITAIQLCNCLVFSQIADLRPLSNINKTVWFRLLVRSENPIYSPHQTDVFPW